MVSSLLDLGPQFLGELKAWFEKEGFVKKPINIPFLVGYPGDSTKELRGESRISETINSNYIFIKLVRRLL